MSIAFRNAVVAAVLAATIACAQQPARVLRICADPNNMPFSNQRLEGFENRLAGIVATALDARVEYVWWAQRRGFVRNTLRQGLCDAVIGVPTELEMVTTTVPYYRSSYVFVTRRGVHQPESFDDPVLTASTIGVHLIGDDFANSPPAHALSARGLIDNVRGYTVYGNYRDPDPPAALIRAVGDGVIDIAVAWGPLAGYFASQSRVPLQLTRVSPDAEPPFPFVYDVSMATARGNTALRDELNRVIASRHAAIDAVLRDYHVPVLPAEGARP